MAFNRSFRFYGVGFGPTDIEINAQINGKQVFAGTVPTSGPTIPPALNPFDEQQIIFTIEDSVEFNTDFGGSVPLEITVTSGDVLIFTTVTANYWGVIPNPAFTAEQYAILDNEMSTDEEIATVLINSANPPFTAEEQATLNTLLSVFPDRSDELNALRLAHNVAYSLPDPNQWQICFTGTPTNSDNTTDPKSSVQINGVAQPQKNPELPEAAQWPWRIFNGDVFTCNWNISPFLS